MLLLRGAFITGLGNVLGEFRIQIQLLALKGIRIRQFCRHRSESVIQHDKDRVTPFFQGLEIILQTNDFIASKNKKIKIIE